MMTPGQRCDEIIRLIDDALKANPQKPAQAPRPALARREAVR
jgi:hypothetical protein